jgi:hypothetical protein
LERAYTVVKVRLLAETLRVLIKEAVILIVEALIVPIEVLRLLLRPYECWWRP